MLFLAFNDLNNDPCFPQAQFRAASKLNQLCFLQSTPVLVVGETKEPEQFLNWMVPILPSEVTMCDVRMPSTNVTKSHEQEVWCCLLFKMVVGVLVLTTSMGTKSMEVMTNAKMEREDLGLTMFTELILI